MDRNAGTAISRAKKLTASISAALLRHSRLRRLRYRTASLTQWSATRRIKRMTEDLRHPQALFTNSLSMLPLHYNHTVRRS